MAEESGFSRRAFIGTVAAAGASALAPAAGLAQRAGATTGKGLIDFHHHFDPPPAVTGRQGGGNQRWTAQGTVEEMEKTGVGVGMANLTASGTASADTEAGRKWARNLNDWGAKTAGDYKGKFGLFATLPMLDVDGALKEVEYAYETLKVDGIGIGTSYTGLWLGDAKYKPLWSELHRRNGIVYVHPNDDQCCTTRTMTYEANGISSAWMEWPVNTARTIMSLMVNGVTREYPGVRFIFSHGGGVAPLIIHRIVQFEGWTGMGPDRLKTFFPRGIETEFRTLYFECAQAFSPVNLDALMKLVPSSHILFGTDYNRFPLAHSAKLLAGLKLPNDVRRGIERDNAVKLFPRFS